MGKIKTLNVVLGLLFFGSLWGIFEASFGDWLYSNEINHPSLYLTTIALVILASSKVFLPYKLTGSLVGLIAMLFKLVNIPFFACHLLAIFLFGVGFDIAYALVTRFTEGTFRLPLIGMIGNYFGRALFAFIITYVVQYQYWTAVGLPKIIDYIFISGSFAALLGIITVPAGTYIGKRVRELSWSELYPQFSTAAVFAATLGIKSTFFFLTHPLAPL